MLCLVVKKNIEADIITTLVPKKTNRHHVTYLPGPHANIRIDEELASTAFAVHSFIICGKSGLE
jgi:hypothetical protein